MLKMEEYRIRKHTRNLPCFTCLVRPLCVDLFDESGKITRGCETMHLWGKKRDKIMNDSSLRKRIMREEVLKVLRKEKERYAKSSKNR